MAIQITSPITEHITKVGKHEVRTDFPTGKTQDKLIED